MFLAEVIKAGRQNEYVKPIGMAVNISKAYLELREPLKGNFIVFCLEVV
jgi:hypothetical protein